MAFASSPNDTQKSLVNQIIVATLVFLSFIISYEVAAHYVLDENLFSTFADPTMLLRTFSPLWWAAKVSSILFFLSFIWTGFHAGRALGIAVAGTGLLWFFELIGTANIEDLAFFSSLYMTLAFYILVPYLQTLQETGKKLPYRHLFDHAWDNALLYKVAFSFALLCMGIVALMIYLFSIVDISVGGGPRPYVYAAALGFGAGLALARHSPWLKSAWRRIVFALFRLLIIPVAVSSVIFLVALLLAKGGSFASGNESVWALLVLFMLMLVCVNVVIKPEATAPNPTRWIRLGGAALIVMLALYAALLIYFTWHRISVFGLTPQRISLAVLIDLAALYSLGYLITLYKAPWDSGLPTVNKYLGIVSMVVFLLLALPPISLKEISLKNQISRLENGRISALDFDYWYVYDTLGKRDEKTIAALTAVAATHPQGILIKEALDLARTAEWTYDWHTKRKEWRARHGFREPLNPNPPSTNY